MGLLRELRLCWQAYRARKLNERQVIAYLRARHDDEHRTRSRHNGTRAGGSEHEIIVDLCAALAKNPVLCWSVTVFAETEKYKPWEVQEAAARFSDYMAASALVDEVAERSNAD